MKFFYYLCFLIIGLAVGLMIYDFSVYIKRGEEKGLIKIATVIMSVTAAIMSIVTYILK